MTQELPAHLAENTTVPTTGHAVVGISMGGSSALILAAHHPGEFIYAGSLSGFLNLSAAGQRGQAGIAMMWNGGFSREAMWGPPGDPAWARNDPTVQAGRLALVCVVGVDHQWGLEVGVYKRTFTQPSPQPGVHWSKDVRFDKIGEGFGCHGEYVEKDD